MLVNLTIDQKKRVPNEKRVRKFLHIPDCREHTKNWMKQLSHGGFFRPYKPLGDEYTADTMNKFVGVYQVMDVNFHESFINNMMKQRALEWNDCGGYDTGDVWYSYGLCDNATQVVEYYNKLKAEGHMKGNHVILLSFMGRNSGWRWHKWGSYIGNFEPRCEYFEDEDESIHFVYAFDIVKVV